MKKLKRIWRAFCQGFWMAWLEVPPSRYRSVSELCVTLTCDSSQFDLAIVEAMKKMACLARVQS